MSKLNASDLKKLAQAVEEIDARRQVGEAASTDVLLSCGNVKLYHMGASNPVVRADFRLKQNEQKED